VENVLGKAGRAETSTDNAPISMMETIVQLKPKSQWRNGITKDKIISELDKRLQIPGVRNGWTQPIINRINMLSTGVRTDLGVKVFGDNLDTLERLAIEAEKILKTINGAADLYAERTIGGEFLDIDVKPEKVARYGINVGDVLNLIETAIGGENISTTVEGRKRFPIRVRFAKDFRDNVEALKRILVPVPRMMGDEENSSQQSAISSQSSMGMEQNSQLAIRNSQTENRNSEIINRKYTFIPLSMLADIKQSAGPPMISSENSLLRSIVFLNVRGRDMGSFVNEAKEALEKNLQLPAGYYVAWSGQWENQLRAKERMQLVLPIVFLIIFLMLYFITKDFAEAFVVMLSVPFALIGGVYLVYALGYNFSVAVWVGFIALYGLAVETGVLMVVYLHEALDRKLHAYEKGEREKITEQDITDATIEGSVLRLRPKVMTVGTALIGLLPIMWSSGVGADLMKPLAAPMIGGLITSTIHVLVVTPILFHIMKTRALKKGKLEKSKMAGWMK